MNVALNQQSSNSLMSKRVVVDIKQAHARFDSVAPLNYKNYCKMGVHRLPINLSV